VKILVLGLGNDLWGDDGVGLQAVRRLEEQWSSETGPGPAGVEVDFKECYVSGAALLDFIHGYEALVIIDTILKPAAGAAAGRVSIHEAAEARDLPGPSPHYISVAQTLVLGRALGLKVPAAAKLVAVEVEGGFRLGEGLTQGMTARLPAIVEAARTVVLDLAETAQAGANPSPESPPRPDGDMMNAGQGPSPLRGEQENARRHS